MAQDYNLGRVQGKGLWIADSTFTTSGTITLESGFTISPLTQDYVIDKETNNVYSIASISGTNPFNFTTNGTPIFTIGGGSIFQKSFYFKNYTRNVVVDTKTQENFTEFFNYALNNDYIVILNSQINFKDNNTVTYFKVYSNPYIQSNRIITWYNETRTDDVSYSDTNKYFLAQGTQTIHGGYIQYSVIDKTSLNSFLYNETSLDLVSLQTEENTYQFNNNEFKNNLIKEPYLVFLTINNHEYKGFFKKDNLYKHIDYDYKLNEETQEEEIIKTYTCIINLDTYTISYTEEEVN